MRGIQILSECFWLLLLVISAPIWVPIVLIYGGCFLSKEDMKMCEKTEDEANINFWLN